MPDVTSDTRALSLPDDLAVALAAAARSAAPREACGLLLGRGRTALELRTLENRAVDRERAFALDPGDVVRADAAARAAGLDVVATWHSHAAAPARPSRRDLALAADWPDLAHVVVTPRGELAAWDAVGALRVVTTDAAR